MFDNFGINITNLFKNAEKERLDLCHPYVGTEHLLLAILKTDDSCNKTLNKHNITYDSFYKELFTIVGTSSRETTINLYTPLLKRVISNALNNAKENNEGIVTIRHLLLSILEEGEGIAIRLLIGMGVDIDKLYEDLKIKEKNNNKKLNIYEIGNILNDKIDMEEIVVGRDKEIELIVETLLRRKKNNPLLIGDAGVGKTAIVEELVRRIERKEVPEELFDKKVVMLEMGALVSGTKYRGEFEEKLTNILREVEQNSNIILFIDEIHTMVNAGGAEGAITAGDILKPALARGNIKCIGATTIHEYNKYFEFDKALKRRFELIIVEEPNKEETKNILIKVKKEYEDHHKVKVNEEVITEIVNITDKYIHNKKNPDKSIDYLDSLCSYVKLKNNYINDLRLLYNELDRTHIEKEESIRKNNYDLALNLYNEEMMINDKIKSLKNNLVIDATKEDVLEVLENKTNIPLTKVKLHFLNKLKDRLKKNYYNLDNEIDTIISTLYDNLLNKNIHNKFLLKGGIGLGKSSLVKDIVKEFKRVNIINLDMKEFTNSMSISKLMGVSSGYVGYNDDYIFNKIKNNPFNILVIDNYEETSLEIKNIINEILENGCIRDNRGELISFNSTIIFMIENTFNENIVGFNNELNNKNNDLNSLFDLVINFKNINYDILEEYLKILNIDSCEIEKIIKDSNYKKTNYKNIKNLILNSCIKN